ncbi:MAG TPA: hypothetical protein VHA11_10110, partial [Bryobacteraceae bacterium]|nr:hypothetical protein [Bryobacteraceae bacterium]
DARYMRWGIPRLLGWCGTSLPERAGAFRAFDCTVRQKNGTIAEIESFRESLSQVRATGSLGDMPLVVLAQDPEVRDPQAKAYMDAWRPLQRDMARLSTRGSLVFAKGSGHQIHRDRPDLVIAAVRQVVAAVR